MDTAAEVTVQQRFENRETQPIEVEYQFKLDSKKVAVTSFVAFIDGKKGTPARAQLKISFHSKNFSLRSQGNLEGERRG
jgi:formylglycine-generating enzyme required for sulfatase activity